MSVRTAILRRSLVGAGLAFSLTASAQSQDNLQTCTDVQTYCMRLCAAAVPPPPPDWTCAVNRCAGLTECLTSGHYRMGTQYGHHTPRRTTWGPFEKK